MNCWIDPVTVNSQHQVISNNTLWRNGIGMNWFPLPTAVQMYGNKFLENTGGDFSMYHIDPATNYFTWRPNMRDSLFVGDMNSPYSRKLSNRVVMALPNEEFYYLSGATFVNYPSDILLTACVPRGCLCAPMLEPFSDKSHSGVTYRTERLRFINTTKVNPPSYSNSNVTQRYLSTVIESARLFYPQRFLLFLICRVQIISWSRTDIYWDLDGSLTRTGIPNTYVSAQLKYNSWPECTVSETLGSAGVNGIYCDPGIAIRKVTLSSITPYSTFVAPVR
jgi:hypothetical protein